VYQSVLSKLAGQAQTGKRLNALPLVRLGIITKSKEENIDYFSNNSEATRLDGFH